MCDCEGVHSEAKEKSERAVARERRRREQQLARERQTAKAAGCGLRSMQRRMKRSGYIVKTILT